MSSDGEKELVSPVLEGEAPTPPLPVDSLTAHPPSSHTLSTKLKQLLACPSKQSHGDNEPKLKKEFTVLSGVGFIAGNIIGSGIFITPRNIFVNTGSFGLTLVAWVIGGLIALAGGLCYIELGVVVRKSGGEYPILRTAYSFNNRNRFVKTLGAVLGFLYAWSGVLVIRSLSISISLLSFAQYLSRPFYIDCDPPKAVVTTLALAGLCELSMHTHTPHTPPTTYTPHTRPHTPHTYTHTYTPPPMATTHTHTRPPYTPHTLHTHSDGGPPQCIQREATSKSDDHSDSSQGSVITRHSSRGDCLYYY